MSGLVTEDWFIPRLSMSPLASPGQEGSGLKSELELRLVMLLTLVYWSLIDGGEVMMKFMV